MKILLSVLLALMIAPAVMGQNYRQIRECVLENGVLKEIPVDYDPATGDKTVMVNGVRTDFDTAQSRNPEYAHRMKWYINNDTVKLAKDKYIKYGLPRILGTTDVVKFTRHGGIAVFQEAGIPGRPEVIYIPVRQGCEFQPYQLYLPECGRISITPNVDSMVKQPSITMKVNAPEAKGAVTYNWTVYGGQLTSSADVQTVTMKPAEKALFIEVVVDVKSPLCRSRVTKAIDFVAK